MTALHAIILAAGQGTRMKSALPKVLHPIAGRPMLAHVMEKACALGAQGLHVVHGHGGEAVQQWFARSSMRATAVSWALQAEQLGTAHAVAQALPNVPDDATVLVLYGDVPLVPTESVAALVEAGHHGLALLTTQLQQPQGYGRIVRDAQQQVLAIVEENDATPQQRAIQEINTGLMAAPARLFRSWVQRVGNQNAKAEYYLTDVVALAVADGAGVQTVSAPDSAVFEGVNDRQQLARAERLYQRFSAEALMRQGVTLADPARFDMRGSLRCGRDVVIDVGVVIEGDVVLGDGVSVGPYSVLRDVTLGNATQVLSHCVLEGVDAGEHCRIGPFARLRPGTVLAPEVHIGNFVEIKNSQLGAGSKAGHLSYLGDAQLGADINVGAGVITCNYDGANKHRTVIGDGVFIGSDTQLVAPVAVGRGATIGAGSTITQDVPEQQLTVARVRGQVTVPGWKRPDKTKS